MTLRQHPTPRPSDATRRRRTFEAWSPTPPERPRPRCSRRRSAPTSSARWRRTPTARRWSRSPPADGGPGPSWTATSTRSPVGLVRAGIGKGDRVGIWSPNCAEWTLTQFATAKIGAVLVNVNPAYRTHELAYALNQSGTKLLISRDRVQDQRLPRDGRPRCVDETPARAGAVSSDTASGPTTTCTTPASRWPEVAGRLGWPISTPDDPINIQYTSGTTGYPKGATLSHRNILNNGYFTTELINFTEQDRLCIPVPFYHCFGMVMGNLGCTTHGATMVIPAPGFDPEITLRTIAEERCTARLRRTDDVHRDAEPPDVRRPRPLDRCAPGSWPARSARSR